MIKKKVMLIAPILVSTVLLVSCIKSNSAGNEDIESEESSSVISTGSNIGNEIMKSLSKTDREDYSLRMKFKTDDKVLTIYSIKGYRIYQNMSGYYIDILRSLQRSDLSEYNQVKINTDSFNATFDVNTIKSLPLSDTDIKKLGYEDDGDVDYDEFVDNYLKSKTVVYKDKDNEE